MPTLSIELVLSGLLALGAGLIFVAVVRRSPRAGIALWLLTVAFVPIWVSITVVISLPMANLVGVAVAVSLWSRRVPRWGVADLLVLFLFISALAPLAIGRLSAPSAFGVLLVWVTGYALGRLAPSQVGESWLYGCVAVIFSIVGVLALVEFLTGWHGLSSWGPANAAKATWSPIQGRGGLERAEGAFGHSIALGSSLAATMVVTLQSRFRPAIRLAMVAVMLGGTVVALSRTGLICALMGLVLAVLFLGRSLERKVRLGLGVVIAGGAVAVLPFLSDVFSTAGTEATGSASYRGNLLSLLRYVDILGTSESMRRTVTGELSFAGFKSIDSQLILFALSYGWMTLVWVMVLLGLAVVAVVAGRPQAPMVAAVAQIPALMTVALITQYALLFWFVVGLAVATQSRDASSRITTTANLDRGRDSNLEGTLGR
ncbi:MAG: hypothetical protein ABWY58_00120 [Aeromicrobium sp.]